MTSTTIFCQRHGRISVSRLRDTNDVYVCPYCAQRQLMRLRHGKPQNADNFQAAVYTLQDPPQFYIGI
mgnify:CR=1 FL=1